jgi:hypothetical protein
VDRIVTEAIQFVRPRLADVLEGREIPEDHLPVRPRMNGLGQAMLAVVLRADAIELAASCSGAKPVALEAAIGCRTR